MLGPLGDVSVVERATKKGSPEIGVASAPPIESGSVAVYVSKGPEEVGGVVMS